MNLGDIRIFGQPLPGTRPGKLETGIASPIEDLVPTIKELNCCTGRQHHTQRVSRPKASTDQGSSNNGKLICWLTLHLS